ncbi:hypothetical protein VM1G_11994 [Cytospora mali]|uniref:Uncharacterized protein n=1 Tax=Cytospora mali TaxID=578113 RepID=A0A194VHS9_CYTMA|nr:hypothetical protein VM1G_11994 [Valsa mali]
MLQQARPLVALPRLGDDWVHHNTKSNIIDGPVRHRPPLALLAPRQLERTPHGSNLGVPLGLDIPPLALIVRTLRHSLLRLAHQQLQDLPLELAALAQAGALPAVPALLPAAQDELRHGAERLVLCPGGDLVRALGVLERDVKVLELDLRLGHLEEGLHVVWGEGEAGLAVGDGVLPALELDTCHGAVGVEAGVFGVGDDTGTWGGGRLPSAPA